MHTRTIVAVSKGTRPGMRAQDLPNNNPDSVQTEDSSEVDQKLLALHGKGREVNPNDVDFSMGVVRRALSKLPLSGHRFRGGPQSTSKSVQ